MTRTKKSQYGFTIMEVLVAVAIGGIAMAGVVAMVEQVALSQATQKYGYEANNLNEEIRTALGSNVACAKSFAGFKPSTAANGASVPYAGPIITNNGTATYAAGGVYGDGAVKLASMKLSNYQSTAGGSGASTGTVTLGMNYDAVSNVQGTAWLYRSINLQMTTDNNGVMNSCIALGKGTDGLWQTVPNTNQDIYYAGGKVGVGNATPGYPFSVLSGVNEGVNLASSTTFGVVGINNASSGSSAKSALYFEKNSSPLFALGNDLGGAGQQNFFLFDEQAQATRLFVDPSGNVGINTSSPSYTVDVAGTGVVAMRLNGTTNNKNSNNTQLRFAGGRSGELWAIGTDVYAGNGGTDFTLYSLSYGPVMDLQAAGNVGVGLTNPAFKLDVSGDIAVSGTDAIRRDGSNAYLFPWGSGYAGSTVYLGGGATTSLYLPSGNLTLGSGSFYVNSGNINLNGSETVNGGNVSVNNGSVVVNNGTMQVNNGDIYLSGIDALRRDGNEAYLFPWGTGYGNENVVVGGGANTNLMVTGGLGVGYNNTSQPAGFLGVSNGITIGSQNSSVGALLELHQNGASGGQAMVYLQDSNVQVGYNISATAGGSAMGQIGTISGHAFQIYTANTPRVTIGGEGNAFFTNNVTVSGTVTSAGGFARSDLRLKKDLQPLQNPLDLLLKIQGKSYLWRNPKSDSRRQIGVIAQDVEKVYPELVREGEDGFKSVSYNGLIAPIIESLRELLAKILGLDTRVKELERQAMGTAKRLDDLEKQNQRLEALIRERLPVDAKK